MPFLVISSLFIYSYFNGVDIHYRDNIIISDNEAVGFPDGMICSMVIVFLWQVISIFSKIFKQKYMEAFMYFTIRSVVIIFAYKFGYQLYPHFTHKLENFEKEKRLYWNDINSKPYLGIDRKGKLVEWTELKGCKIIYDETDTLMQPDSNYRNTARYFKSDKNEFLLDYHHYITQSVHDKEYYEISMPIQIKKIEPNFYYMCLDFQHKIKVPKQETAEKLLQERELFWKYFYQNKCIHSKC